MKYLVCSLLAAAFIGGCRSRNEKPVIIESRGNRIAYQSCGRGDTTLLFIHGWCISKEYWENQVAFFCPRYRVVTMDLPGFGQSGKNLDSSWQFGNYSDDVRTVIGKLQLQHVILIGHSMSGDIVLDVARRYPDLVAGIVGIDNLHQPAGVLPDSTLAQIDGFFSLMEDRYDSVVRRNMEGILFQPATDSLIRKRVMGDILATDHPLAVKVLRANTLIAQQQQEAMKALRHPLCLVNSDVFPVSTDSLKKYCAKGFRLQWVHGTGHYPMLEKPDEFNAALQQIIDGMPVK